MSNKVCPIDSVEMEYKFSARMLSKHDVAFFQCPCCSLLQTEEPYWLKDAYVQAYTDMDTGLAARNFFNRFRVEPVLNLLFKCQGEYLDVGGGYGLFTRLMRDIGISCFSTDKYCENFFARTFNPRPNFKATALFAFEVFEHLPDPVTFLVDNFSKYHCKTIIFSTETLPEHMPSKEWPYYGFPHGQHITFYSSDSLRQLAAHFGCTYLHLFSDFHFISDRNVTFIERLILRSRPLFLLYAALVRIKRWRLSFTHSDASLLTEGT